MFLSLYSIMLSQLCTTSCVAGSKYLDRFRQNQSAFWLWSRSLCPDLTTFPSLSLIQMVNQQKPLWIHGAALTVQPCSSTPVRLTVSHYFVQGEKRKSFTMRKETGRRVRALDVARLICNLSLPSFFETLLFLQCMFVFVCDLQQYWGLLLLLLLTEVVKGDKK